MQRTLVIIGPSGAGKSTLVAELARRGVVTVVPTWTTRPRRPDEHDGSMNHCFVDDVAFDLVDRGGGFVGTAALFGHRYGLPPIPAVDDGTMPAVVARAGVLGLLLRHAPAPVVVQVEAPPARLLQVLDERGTAADERARRLEAAYDELLAGRFVAGHVVVNDGSVDQLAGHVVDLIGREAVAA